MIPDDLQSHIDEGQTVSRTYFFLPLASNCRPLAWQTVGAYGNSSDSPRRRMVSSGKLPKSARAPTPTKPIGRSRSVLNRPPAPAADPRRSRKPAASELMMSGIARPSRHLLRCNAVDKCAVTQLTEAVVPPGPDRAVALQRHGVGTPRGDGGGNGCSGVSRHSRAQEKEKEQGETGKMVVHGTSVKVGAAAPGRRRHQKKRNPPRTSPHPKTKKPLNQHLC